jgi:outer membrane receptor protein involved in Fe transport
VPSGAPTVNNNPNLPGENDTVVTPRAAAIYHVNNLVSVWGDVGSGFRAPTLNELYRRFSKGTVLTLPNSALGPERLVGGELGVNLAPIHDLTLRVTWFDNRVTNPVSNVTIATSGASVTVQRQNLGETAIQGFQTDAEYRIGRLWRVSGGYVFNQPTIVSNPSNPALVGKFLQEVPQNRGSVRVSYADPRIATITFGVQMIGRQFDTGDDTNTRAVPGATEPGLPAYATAELTVSRAIGRNVDVYAGAQNLFNQQYIVGTLPTTIGSPQLVNVGVRVRFTGR